MEREHTIYLSSTGSIDTYPQNTPSKFTNRLARPIILDPKIEYEIGLVSILYPNEYYAILRHQFGNTISFITKQKGIERENVFRYTIKNNILAGKFKDIIHAINEEIKLRLKVYYDNVYSKLFPNDAVFKWDKSEQKVEIHCNKSPKDDDDDDDDDEIEYVNIHLETNIARILGFRSDTHYPFYGENISENIKSYIPPNKRFGVDYIYLYTDIIQPTNFSGQLVNILDCFTLDNGGNKGIHNTLYKQLNTSYIDQISIIVTNQNGGKIHFREDSIVTCVLHIRPK